MHNKKVITTSGNDGWHSEDMVYKDGLCPCFDGYTLAMSREMWDKIIKIAKEIDKEWLGYFVGDVDKDEKIVAVNKLLIPEQKASSATVNDVKQPDEPTVGVVHSHNTMGASFSGTDENFVNANNKVSLVVNEDGNYSVRSALKLDCGHIIIRDGYLEIVGDDIEIDVDAIEEKIESPTITKKPTRNSKYKKYRGKGTQTTWDQTSQDYGLSNPKDKNYSEMTTEELEEMYDRRYKKLAQRYGEEYDWEDEEEEEEPKEKSDFQDDEPVEVD